jgi:Methyltransferase domain
VTAGAQPVFEHRASYADVDGRDRWEVRAVNRWLTTSLPAIAVAAPPGAVLDVGCGEQPFRPLVEAQRRPYAGMDLVQNSSGTVAMLGDLEHAEPPATPYAIVLCTEVLEHVVDINLSFRGLRRLTMTGGLVMITVPFLFPEHMDPDDFRRLTEHGVAQLARDHGFSVVSSQRLGTAPDVVATMLADVSVLPSAPTFQSRAKTRVLRAAKAWLVSRLASASLADHVTINSNLYLSSGIVLKAIA